LIESTWNNCHSLQELLDPKHFKSYEELKARLEKAIGQANNQSARRSSIDEDEAFPTPSKTASAKEAPKRISTLGFR